MKVTRYTGNTTLSVDDHYVSVANTTGSAITITLPNPTPVDGQQYYIKAINITNPIVVSSAGSGQMMGNNGVPFSTLTMSLGEVVFLVWTAIDNQWLAVNTSAGALSVASLAVTGAVSAATLSATGIITGTGGAVVGTTATASPAKNPCLNILHSSTDNPLASYV